MGGIKVDFYFGLGSRYSYLAFTQINRIEERTGCSFDLHPLSSSELLALCGYSPFDGRPNSGQYDWAYRRSDAAQWAECYGVPFVEPKPLPQDHRLMARACHAADLQGWLLPYCAALFQAVFVENALIGADQCAEIASGLGLDMNRFAIAMTGGEAERRVEASAREAFERGAFGVPTFFVDDKMYWGNDRLVLLERYLRGK